MPGSGTSTCRTFLFVTLMTSLRASKPQIANEIVRRFRACVRFAIIGCKRVSKISCKDSCRNLRIRRSNHDQKSPRTLRAAGDAYHGHGPGGTGKSSKANPAAYDFESRRQSAGLYFAGDGRKDLQAQRFQRQEKCGARIFRSGFHRWLNERNEGVSV